MQVVTQWFEKFWQRISDFVPPSDAACEFECDVTECSQEEWDNCSKRKRHEKAEAIKHENAEAIK